MTILSEANIIKGKPIRSESIISESEHHDEHHDTFDWEIVPETTAFDLKPKMRHTMSSPNLSHLETSEDDSYTFVSDEVSSESSNEQDQQQQQLPPKQTVQNSKNMSRVPSFKDAILLNAEETRNEIQLKKQQQEKARIEALKNRSRSKNIKFVVTPIKRCTKSTGDLRSLITIVDDDDADCSGGGSGGASNDCIMGESDAAEFYASKGHARVSRKNGRKLRPDEAKRKEMIIYKKNLQRQQQQSKSKGKKSEKL